ncbi:DUF2591 domain-containing protein [Providencia alcalifaciens]|uniref:phage protein NinX family protein n=1 Tax=Providencia alcalifaciens TaxID=126385 RepID=UPI0012B5908E|nr:phage protein NinX family protein [Providencia alcalifaciens]MTC37409.1 DUF2591 domain-containing protein [Providencia alcalifaciens]
MNKYTELSDFEINKKVADLIGATPYPTGLNEYHRSAVCGMENAIIIKSPRKVGAFAPCNNPSDAWDIIIENRINLRTVDGYMDWYADHPTNSRIYSHNINPLRACMEVFLMKKDAENES